ncbi:MAG: carboxyl-terminal protease [Bryobacteraceae bacterium]|nr:carboxyl-terminal protease [Bryobacteraceae bacterium]
MNTRLKFIFVGITTLFAAALLVGQVVGRASNPEDAYRHLAVFTDVLSRIKSEYVEEPDMKSVTIGAVNGLLEAVDPYASYLNADQYKQYLKQKDLKKASVGLVLSKRFGYISVVDSIPGSPADKAGLTTGDMIETINAVATRDMPLAFAEILLQGDAGSTIDLSVLRVRKPEPTKISLTRAMVMLPAVTGKLLPDGVGHIRVQSLEDGKTAQISTVIKDLEKQGAKKLVLDLRNAAFGTPEEGVALANLFLDKGLITYSQGQRYSRKDYEASPGNQIWKLPVVVLTNRSTTSGAEIAASALLDAKRAEVVGERTYGDAAKREAISMEDGSAVILAVAKFYNAKGKSIQEAAVVPSRAVVDTLAAAPPDEDDDDEVKIDKGKEAPKEPKKKADEDTILKNALEVLNGTAKASAPATARGHVTDAA